MRCECCQGDGYAKNKHYIISLPCPHCMGSGQVYCCDEAGSNQPNDSPPPTAIERAIFKAP